MQCKECSRDIPENSIFCNWCGARQIRERKKKDVIKVPTPKKLPSGSWNIVLRAEGQSVTEPTEALCLARARAIRAGFLEQKSASKGQTLKAAYVAHLEARCGALSPSTYAGYLALSRNTFQRLMPLDISKITNALVQSEVSKMAENGKSRKYIANALGLLTSVLRTAAPDARIDVHLPQKVKREPRRIEDAEISAIMNAVRGSEIELPVLMGLWLGMRMSEIRGARREDIVDNRLHICRAIVDDKDGKPVEKPPKSFSGDRWVSLPREIVFLIETQCPAEGTLVRLSGQAIYKRFSRTLEAAGIPHCRFHDLRHANAAAMVRLGVDSKYAQERNGWSSDRMYKQVYAYTMSDQMESVDATINAYFANKFTNGKNRP